MKRIAMMVMVAGLFPTAAWAQNEAALRESLEGRTMVLRIDMPGSQLGVDVYPDRRLPVDFGDVARHLKEYGTGIHQGESQTITLIKVKDNLIEVQLGGGGFGTFLDVLSAPTTVVVPTYYKTPRERDLEDQLRYERDWRERQRIQRELDEIRRDRERRNANAAIANRMAQQEVRERRANSGSRFNVRFDGKYVPSEYLTPDGLLRALARYGQVVDANMHGEEYEAAGSGRPIVSVGALTSLKKGMTLQDVERALGPAAAVSRHDVDTMVIEERTYYVGDRIVVARFVSGVMIEYLIRSKG